MPDKISGMRIMSRATLKPDVPRGTVVGRCFASRLSGVIIIVVAHNVAIDGSDQVMYRYARSRSVRSTHCVDS